MLNRSVDCNGDGWPDAHTCMDATGRRGVILSVQTTTTCVNNWPNATVAECPPVFGSERNQVVQGAMDGCIDAS